MNPHYYQSKTVDHTSSDSPITPQQIYQTLIRQTPNLYPLCKFKTKGSNKYFFPDAVKFPDFFNYNLVSPGRVIKKIQGQQSLVRGFYYQLMKLAFEIQVEDKDYIQVLKNVIFSPQFMLQENPSSPSSGKNYSDLQYKKIVAEFMEILIHQSIPNFQLTILSYPIVDEAMTKILENLIKFKTSVDFTTNSQILSFEILQLLSQTFQVTVVQYGNCFKFQQSDIFLYEHSKSQFYIAFLNEMAEMSDMSESSRRKDSSYEQSSSKKIAQSSLDQSGKRQVKTHEYLQSQFEVQEPMRGSQRQVLSNFTEEKKQREQQTGKNNRYKFGFSEIKSQQSIMSNDYESSKMIVQKKIGLNSDKQRESRDSLVNQLHRLEYQTFESYSNNLIKQEQSNKFNVEFPGVQMSKSISQSNSTFERFEQPIVSKKLDSQSYQYNVETSNKYQYQPKGYAKKVAFQQPTNFMRLSAQSDEDIGYTQTTKKQNKYPNHDYTSKFNFLTSNQSNKILQNTNKNQYDSESKLSMQRYHSGFSQTNKYQQKFNKKQNFTVPHYQISKLDSTTMTGTSKYTNKPEQDIFYSPKPLISKPTFLPQPLNYQQQKIKNQESVGTLYRQFTDTKLLDILPDQVQYNIKKMKRKYKGVHSKDFFGYKKY